MLVKGSLGGFSKMIDPSASLDISSPLLGANETLKIENPRIFVMSTLSSLMATSGATRDDKVDILTPHGFQWLFNFNFIFDRYQHSFVFVNPKIIPNGDISKRSSSNPYPHPGSWLPETDTLCLLGLRAKPFE